MRRSLLTAQVLRPYTPQDKDYASDSFTAMTLKDEHVAISRGTTRRLHRSTSDASAERRITCKYRLIFLSKPIERIVCLKWFAMVSEFSQ